MKIVFSVELDPGKSYTEDEAMDEARSLARDLWSRPVVAIRIEGVTDEA